MKYGKIVCGALVVPQIYPGYIELEGKKIYNPTEEQYLAAGYLPIEEHEPEEREGKVAIAYYEVDEANTKIIQYWYYVDEPEGDEPEATPDGIGG